MQDAVPCLHEEEQVIMAMPALDMPSHSMQNLRFPLMPWMAAAQNLLIFLQIFIWLMICMHVDFDHHTKRQCFISSTAALQCQGRVNAFHTYDATEILQEMARAPLRCEYFLLHDG